MPRITEALTQAPAETELLPSDIETEKLVLGSIMIGAIEFRLAAASLDIDDFAIEAHRRIWRRMEALHRRGEHADRVLLERELTKHGELESVGGLTYLVDLDTSLPTLPNLEGYIRRLKELSLRRRIIRKSDADAKAARISTVEPQEIVESASAFYHDMGLANGTGNAPDVVECRELFESKVAVEKMLFDGFPTPATGATLIVGASKTGKTLLAIQLALAVTRGTPLFDYYRTLETGAVLVIEQDDPAGLAAIAMILKHSGATPDLPIAVVGRVPFTIGPHLLDWLEQQITERSLKVVVLDSYTALRGPRRQGVDIVKQEQSELSDLDALAKRLGMSILVIHHGSKGSSALDWSLTAAGTFAMTMATEAQVNVARFTDLQGNERLIRIRGRHASDVHLVLRFAKETLNFEFVMEGPASEYYPALRQIRAECGGSFGPKDVRDALGLTEPTTNRLLARLRDVGGLQKAHHGSYNIAPGLRL